MRKIKRKRPKPLTFKFKEFWECEAIDLLSAREKGCLLHTAGDIRASGEELEDAARSLFSRVLPHAYYVSTGHIVDKKLNCSSEVDIIVTNRNASTALFRGVDGSEYLPFETVYGIGEVKNTFQKDEFRRALDKVAKLKDLERERTTCQPFPSWRYGNPLFSFILFASSDDLKLEDLKILKERPLIGLPNIVCFLDRGLALYGVVAEYDNRNDMHWTPRYHPEFEDSHGDGDGWRLVSYQEQDSKGGGNLAALYFGLWWHLQYCILPNMNTTAYMSNFLQMHSTTKI